MLVFLPTLQPSHVRIYVFEVYICRGFFRFVAFGLWPLAFYAVKTDRHSLTSRHDPNKIHPPAGRNTFLEKRPLSPRNLSHALNFLWFRAVLRSVSHSVFLTFMAQIEDVSCFSRKSELSFRT